MYKDARESNLEYIEKPGKFTSDVSNFHLRYVNDNELEYSSFQITMSPAKESLHTTENLAGYTRIKKDGIDFLYRDHQIYFIKEDNSKKFLINISTSWSAENFDENVEREEIMEIAKNFLD